MTVQVVVVDDEIDLPNMIRDYLEDVTDFRVMIALSGKEGLGICTRLHPDVCIVDMRLPDITGNEFILAAHKLSEKCKFIIHTGSLNYVIPEELKKIGVLEEAVLFKPVLSLANVVETIQLILKR